MYQDTYPTYIEQLELLPTCLLFLHQLTPHQIYLHTFLPYCQYLPNSLTGSNPLPSLHIGHLLSIHAYAITYSIAGIMKKNNPIMKIIRLKFLPLCYPNSYNTTPCKV